MGSGVFRQSMKDHDYASKNGDIENSIHFANHFFGNRFEVMTYSPVFSHDLIIYHSQNTKITILKILQRSE